MPRRKPTPPPNPSLPLLTIDTLAVLLFRPLLSPTTSLLPALSLLALGHAPLSRAALTAYAFALATLTLQLFLAIDARIAGGPARRIDWSAEVVLVTGGAGGLGSCIASALGLRGADVAVADVLPATPERVEQWDAAGCRYYACDVGEPDAVNDLAARVARDFEHPATIVIHAAALATHASLLATPSSTLARDLRTNTVSLLHLTHAFLPSMLTHPRGGTIVTVSSVLGALGCAGLGGYAASKAALTALHRSLRAEIALLAPAGRVNTILVAPGQLGTPLFGRVVPPSAFFGPVVSPAMLAADVIAAVEAGRDAEIAAPLYARWIGWYGVLPQGVRAVARRVAGLDGAAWRAGGGGGGAEGKEKT